MQTKIVGGGVVQPGPELIVDPTFGAARISLRPLDYNQIGQILGHYRATVTTSAIAPSANVLLFSLRWADPVRYFVLGSLSAGITVATAVTAQRTDPLAAFVQRSYTASETAGTLITLSGSNQKQRILMGTSLVTEMRVAAAAGGITGGTRTADANPFGGVTVTGLTAVGTGLLVQTMFTQLPATHPTVLSTNEGISVNWGATALATGTITVSIVIDWAEVAVY